MKIGVIGASGSGKTSFFLGMIKKIAFDKSDFSIMISDLKVGLELKNKMVNLADASLPSNERWPDPNGCWEEYTFELLDSGNKIADVQWIDCPIEYFLGNRDRLSKKLCCVDCLFVCVDGGFLQGNKDDLDNITDDFYSAYGADLCNALLCVAEKSDVFPPVCILITKYDAVSPKLQDSETIKDFVKACIPILFYQGGGMDRVVTICPVSLGKDIAEGGKLRPRNVQYPLFAALYFYIYKMLHVLPDTHPVYQMMAAEQFDLLQDLRALPLYVNGSEVSWPD